MDNSVQIFSNPEFGTIRTLDENGAILFCGADVAKALGYVRPKDAIATHCKGAVKRRTLTDGGAQEMSFIPEPDLYRLVFRSKLPTAEAFTDWVTSEVLPSIRKNGGYIAGQEKMTDMELLASAFLVAKKTIEDRDTRIAQLETEKAVLAPKADYYDDLVDNGADLSIRETAKELHIPERILVEWLLKHSYLYRAATTNKLMPYSEYSTRAKEPLFTLKERTNRINGFTCAQTMITVKGRDLLRKECASLRT